MALVDGRTTVDAAEATTNWVNDSGGAFPGGTNSDTFIKGNVSIAERVSSGTLGFMVDLSTATDVSDNTFYFWWNVSTAGLLDTLANGGVRMRFCGATITDYFEVHLAGKDTYSGGWTMSVVNIEEAKTAADAADPNTGTGGTSPATTAIRYVGIFFDMASMVSGNVDNCFVDYCWRLPADTAGLRVEGDNSPGFWTWQDIIDFNDPGDTTKALGMAFRRDGVVFINAPIQFGTDDASNANDQFSDTNEVIFFEDHRVPDNFYELSVVGASGGTANQYFRIGTRTGSGATSTGGQGGVIGAPTTGFAPRWNLTMADADLVQAEILGSTMQHINVIDMGNDVAEIRSSTLIDANSVFHSGGESAGAGTGDFSKNTVLNANTADGVAMIETDDPSAIIGNSFTFSDGHAIEVTTLGVDTAFTFQENTFNGYAGTDGDNLVENSGSNDAEFLNTSGREVTLNITDGTTIAARNSGTGSTTVVNNNVAITLTGMKDNTEVRVYTTGTTTELAGIEVATAGSVDARTFTFSVAGGASITIRTHNLNWIADDIVIASAAAGSIPVAQSIDRVYVNP
jgi:hypothetical protein